MNDIFASRRHKAGTIPSIKHLAWKLAGKVHLTGLYGGQICPSWLRFVRRDMPVPGLGGGMDGLKIVHIADLHCSPIVLDSYLRNCLEHVNSLEPDLVVATGDLIMGGTCYAVKIARLLEKVNATYGTAVCFGNHDYGVFDPEGLGYMRQLPEFLQARLEAVGVRVLRNSHMVLHHHGSALQIVGAEDFWSPLYNPWAAFGGTDANLPTVCLCHNPDAAEDMIEMGADWVLAGHTHGNGYTESRMIQSVAPQLRRDLIGGHYRLGRGQLYINRGLSYSRRNPANPSPEITVLTLRDAPAVDKSDVIEARTKSVTLATR